MFLVLDEEVFAFLNLRGVARLQKDLVRLCIQFKVLLDGVALDIKRQDSLVVEADHDEIFTCKVHSNIVLDLIYTHLADQVYDRCAWERLGPEEVNLICLPDLQGKQGAWNHLLRE